MTVYIVPSGGTLYSRKNRAQGWRQVALDRPGFKLVKSLSHLLRDKGVVRVFASDLLEQSAKLVGRELKLPVTLDQNWRHFNVGRHAGKHTDTVNGILEKVVEQWKTDPTIPIAGGDSLKSWQTRTLTALRRTLASPGDVVLVSGGREISALKALVTSESFDASSLLATVPDDRVYILRWATAGLSGSPKAA